MSFCLTLNRTKVPNHIMKGIIVIELILLKIMGKENLNEWLNKIYYQIYKEQVKYHPELYKDINYKTRAIN